jgi:hypothetical protein
LGDLARGYFIGLVDKSISNPRLLYPVLRGAKPEDPHKNPVFLGLDPRIHIKELGPLTTDPRVKPEEDEKMRKMVSDTKFRSIFFRGKLLVSDTKFL